MAESKTPKIGYICIDENDNKQIKVVRELTTVEYESFCNAREELLQFTKEQRPFEILGQCYDELYKNIKNCSQDDRLKPSMYPDFKNQVLNELNKSLMGFLTAYKTFDDHNRKALSRAFGKTSQEYKLYEESCHFAYDNYRAYRLFSYIRDYAQHCELPISGIDLSATWDKEHNQVCYNRNIFFDRDEFIKKDKNIKEKYKNVLMEYPEKIEVSIVLPEFMEGLLEINGNLIIGKLPRLKKHVDFITSLVQTIPNLSPIYEPLIFKEIKANKPDIKISSIRFPLREIEMVSALWEELNDNS